MPLPSMHLTSETWGNALRSSDRFNQEANSPHFHRRGTSQLQKVAHLHHKDESLLKRHDINCVQLLWLT